MPDPQDRPDSEPSDASTPPAKKLPAKKAAKKALPVDSIHGRGALDVLEDGLAVGDRLPSGPGTESET